jgi:hypothetical protein
MKYLGAWAYMMAMAVVLLTVVVVGIYWVLYSKSFIAKVFGAIYITLGIFLMTDRDVFLPFLGEMVFPKALLVPKVPAEATETVRVRLVGVPDGTPVVYWAAEPGETAKDPWMAYGNYENAGVALTLLESVDLKVRSPASYKIPSGRVLKRHIHYRVMGANGMLGSVETVWA